jgi:hypothetical protein
MHVAVELGGDFKRDIRKHHVTLNELSSVGFGQGIIQILRGSKLGHAEIMAVNRTVREDQ